MNDALRIVGEKMIETINRFNNLKRKFRYNRMEIITSENYEAKSYWMDILINPLINTIIPEGLVYNARLKGKSGSEIFFSSDFRLAIKTIRKKEFECLGEIIEKYIEYQKINSQSLLVKYYGVYHIKIIGGREFFFVVMKNIFEGVYNKIYDLKGLNIKRTNNSGILTENDIKIKGIPKIHDVTILKNAIKDSDFLRELGLIDYSIIIGVNEINDDENIEIYDDFYYVNENEFMKYNIKINKKNCIGIVDILTNYDKKKIIEEFYYFICCKNNKSTASPDKYQERFINIIKLIFKDENNNDIIKSNKNDKENNLN